GEAVTGVTAMQMDAGIDTGDMILKQEVPIGEEETAGTLYDALAAAGAKVTGEILAILSRGECLPREPQREEDATYAPILTKEDGRIDWTMSARQIVDRIRAFTPWPSCYTYLRGQKLAIRGLPVDQRSRRAWASAQVSEEMFWVQTGKGVITVESCSFRKKMMPAVHLLK
ncbi:MAG: methionyl-tRNA formyltransferase, partial [Bianqueaceae bacterium]